MEKLVIFQPSDGDFFNQGFKRINILVYPNRENNQVDFKQLTGKLPPAPHIAKLFQSWREKYQILLNNLPSNNFQRGFVDAQVTHISLQDFNHETAVLRDYLNEWLDSETFILTKSDLQQALQLTPQDEIRVVIQTARVFSPETQNILHRLPWYWWNLFPNHYKIEFAISLNEFRPSFINQENTLVSGNGRLRRVKVLGIFGNSENSEGYGDIDVETDQRLIKDLRGKGASPRFLHQPKRSEFTELWHEAVDIFCFSGHSNSTNDCSTGWLYINSDEEGLEIKELRNVLRTARDKGLQLVIFNSCDGLGLAQAISDLNIPQVIVWRESVPDIVAQRFLFYFLQSFAYGNSLYQSVREAREKLQLEGLEQELPGVTASPVIVDNSGREPITWKQIRRTGGRIAGEWNQVSMSKEESNNRQILLNKLNNCWIKPILENQLQSQIKIELGLEEQPDALNLPSRIAFETSQQHRRNLPLGTRAIDVFDELNGKDETTIGRTLLLLGEPGSGKTITLLEIARDLVADAWEDETLPIPVFLNLSSWSGFRGGFLRNKTFTDWLIQQLFIEYGIPKSQVNTWIENQKLLFLLDGLDEVKEERRLSCITEINQFIRDNTKTEVIVCSRIQDYNNVSEKFQFQAAIYIQPLTREQINKYLQQGGEQLTAIKTLLQEDENLLSLAKHPLMLNIITIAFQGVSLKELRAMNSVEDSSQNLFENYINRMFERRTIRHKYSKKNTLDYLIWLAQRMEASSESKLIIEQLQPDWLQTNIQNWTYHFGLRFIFGLIGGLAMSLHFATQVTSDLVSLISLIIPSIVSAIIFALASGLQPGIFSGVLCGFMYVLMTFLMTWQNLSTELLNNPVTYLSPLIIDGVVFGLFLGLGLKSRNIEIVDTIEWSHFRGLIFTIYGLLLGLVYVGMRLILIRKYYQDNGFYYMLYEMLIFIIISGIIGGLNKGKEVEKAEKANQGIIRSTNYSARFFIMFIPIGMILGIPYSDNNIHEIISIGLAVGLLAGLAGGQFSGLVLIKHLTLRFILWVYGYIPLNFVNFLNYATERIFLQQSGNGYIFRHRLLLECFASLQKNNINTGNEVDA